MVNVKCYMLVSSKLAFYQKKIEHLQCYFMVSLVFAFTREIEDRPKHTQLLCKLFVCESMVSMSAINTTVSFLDMTHIAMHGPKKPTQPTTKK